MRFRLLLMLAIIVAIPAAFVAAKRFEGTQAAPAAVIEQELFQATPLSDAECEAIVSKLPEDAHAYHTSVFTHVRLTSQEREILDWFVRDQQLDRLRRQTHFHHYNQTASVWPRYANLTGELPAVVVQDATGKVIYKSSGQQIPRAPWPLVKGIVECIRAHCPHCPRPRPRPEPEPDDPDDEEVPDDKPVIPDVVGPNENTPLDAKDDTVLAVALVFLLAVAAGFIGKWRGQNNRLL